MKQYQDLEIKIAWFTMQDVVRTSENADDLGGWNSGWFPQKEQDGE